MSQVGVRPGGHAGDGGEGGRAAQLLRLEALQHLAAPQLRLPGSGPDNQRANLHRGLGELVRQSTDLDGAADVVGAGAEPPLRQGAEQSLPVRRQHLLLQGGPRVGGRQRNDLEGRRQAREDGKVRLLQRNEDAGQIRALRTGLT